MELGMTLAWQGDVDQAYPLFEEAEAVLAAPGGDRRLEPVLRARLAANRGDLALIRHDYVRAAELSLTAVELNRDAGNDHGVSTALLNLGVANAQLGRHAEAMASLRDALRLMSTRGDAFGIELCLRGVAAVLPPPPRFFSSSPPARPEPAPRRSPRAMRSRPCWPRTRGSPA